MSISVRTKHFGFIAGRPLDYYADLRRWDKWSVRIGFVDAARPLGEIPYKYWAGIDLQLLPNFIWRQDLIRQDPRVADVQVHTRIVGIQSWPLLRFRAGRP